MTPRIQKAIDILLDAVNEGTLAKGNCAACAVGNLIAHGLGYSVLKSEFSSYWSDKATGKSEQTNWGDLFITADDHQSRTDLSVYDKDYQEVLLREINATDFTIDELAQIEFAFETNTEICHQDYDQHYSHDIRRDQIKGLEAVVKVMLQFDEQTDDVNEVFTSKANLIPIC